MDYLSAAIPSQTSHTISSQSPPIQLSPSQIPSLPLRYYIYEQRDPNIKLRQGYFVENFQSSYSLSNLFQEKIPSVVKSVFHDFYITSGVSCGQNLLAIFSRFKFEAHGDGPKSHGGLKKFKISVSPGVPYRDNYGAHVPYYFPGAGLMNSQYPSEFIKTFNYFIPNFDDLHKYYWTPDPVGKGEWEHVCNHVSSTSGTDFCTYTVLASSDPITHFTIEIIITLQDGSTSRLTSILEVSPQ